LCDHKANFIFEDGGQSWGVGLPDDNILFVDAYLGVGIL
jgi:hypothetical protein|tara:strand:+ start:675 stop:791 length:117 start_codon:yes stop_codon:yes gene_type:complete